MGIAAKVLRLAIRFCKAPFSTIKTLPALWESARMRAAGNSIFRRPEDLIHASSCPSRMLDKALQMWNPKSFLDVGCGTGKVIDYLVARGVPSVQGLEGSALAIQSAEHPDLIKEVDLTAPVDLSRQFDLVYSFEVAEHIPASAADQFVQTLTRHGNRIVMTAARPGQGGLGHLNEQEPAYWEEKFRAAGFTTDAESRDALKSIKDMYYENLMVFVRTG